MTVAISIGNYGGFYFYNGYSKRICLGFIAITYIPEDLDNFLNN
jgi:hypothetical protein